MAEIKIIVGGDLKDDAAAFVDAWYRSKNGEEIRDRALGFESWEKLAEVMTGECYRLLKHIHAQPEPSIAARSRSLGRQYRRVHADVAASEAVGLLARFAGAVHATADTLRAEIHL